MRRLLVVPMAVLALAAAGVAGCGGDDDSSSAAGGGGGGGGAKVADAKATVKRLEAPVEFKAPGPPVDGAKLEGKTLYMVVNGIEFQFVQNIVNGVKEAAKVLGMKTVVVDAAGQTAKGASLIERGVAQKADVIVTQALQSEQLSAPLGEAKDAGIPVIEVTGRDAGFPNQELKDIGISAIASYCYSCVGEQLSATAVATWNGDVKGLVVDSPEFGTSDAILKGLKAGFARLCPDCQLEYKSSPANQWNQLPSLASSSLQSNPNLNALLPVFDEMALLMKPGVLRANAGDKAKFVTWGATIGGLQDIQRGELFEADLGASQPWLGWGIVDQAARLVTGGEAAETENIPHRLFTANNIDEIDPKSPESWYGPVDFRADYTKLWGK